jgi:hypothetical protein
MTRAGEDAMRRSPNDETMDAIRQALASLVGAVEDDFHPHASRGKRTMLAIAEARGALADHEAAVTDNDPSVTDNDLSVTDNDLSDVCGGDGQNCRWCR